MRVSLVLMKAGIQGHDLSLRKTVSRSPSKGFVVGGRFHPAKVVSISVPIARNNDDEDDDDAE